MWRAAWSLVALLAMAPDSGAVSAGPRAPVHVRTDDRGFDCTNAEIEIEIDFDTRTIRGRVVHRFRPTRALDTLRLDLTDSLHVTSVLRGQSEIPFTHAARILEIPFDPPLSPEVHGEVTISYDGRPPRDGLLGFAFHNRDGVPGAFTVSEPTSASGWWPCKDVPDDKLTAIITLDVPDTLYAGSNGLLVSDESAGGRRRMIWQEAWPIAPYLLGIACTKYEPYEEEYVAKEGRALPLLFLPYPEHRGMAEISWGRTGEMLAAFEDRFGPYPFPGEKYGMAEFFWGGAMENQTLTSYGEYLVDGTDQNDWEVAHELAHSWWGNSVTLGSWDHMWLNEGFARYSEALWFESRGGIEAYREWIRGMWRPDLPGAIVPPDYIFSPTVYLKGAWTLHMLRGLLGDGIFFDALRAYGAEFAHGNATTEDLIRVFESSAGRELRWYFDQWVYGTGRPEYELAWTADPEEDDTDGGLLAEPPMAAPAVRRYLPSVLDLTITQTQVEPPFRMPVEIEIRDAVGRYRVTVRDSLREQSFRIPVRLLPQEVRLDPDDWILKGSVGGSSTPEPPAFAAQTGAPWPSPGRPPFRIPLLGGRTAAVEIHDVAGRRVAELPPVSESSAIWDGRDEQGREVPSGVYFAGLAGVRERAVRRIVLLR